MEGDLRIDDVRVVTRGQGHDELHRSCANGPKRPPAARRTNAGTEGTEYSGATGRPSALTRSTMSPATTGTASASEPVGLRSATAATPSTSQNTGGTYQREAWFMRKASVGRPRR